MSGEVGSGKPKHVLARQWKSNQLATCIWHNGIINKVLKVLFVVVLSLFFNPINVSCFITIYFTVLVNIYLLQYLMKGSAEHARYFVLR